MKREELIELTKELLALEDLSSRAADLSFLKREYRRLANREDETFFEKSLTEEFNRLFEELAKKESSLLVSPLEEKKALIAAAKLLIDSPNAKKAQKDFFEIEKSFKAAGRTSKEQDDELWAQLREVRSALEKKLNEYYQNVREGFNDKKAKKEALIEEAKKALEIKNIKEATAKFDALLESWKEVGFAGKESEEALWNEFANVRKEFSTKRKNYYENLKNEFKERKAKKLELIEEVKKFIADSDFSDEELKKIKEFKNAWKNIGFAGKEVEDELWNEFNKAINQYFEDKKFYTM